MELVGANGLPAQTWTCPHCGEQWHTGRQYCSTCKHGMVQDVYGTWVPAGMAAARPLAPPAQAPRRWTPANVPPGPLGDEEPREGPAAVPAPLEDTLRASMAAESRLQAEVTLLRERLAQVHEQAQRERTALLEGVQQWLAPLAEAIRHRRPGPVEVSQVIPLAVALLRGDGPGASQALPVTPAPSMPPWAERLWREVQALRAEVEGLRVAQGPAAPADPYPTWLLTDQRQASLEQTLLAEQQLHGGMAYGEGR